jgi:hypothetical protein
MELIASVEVNARDMLTGWQYPTRITIEPECEFCELPVSQHTLEDALSHTEYIVEQTEPNVLIERLIKLGLVR